MFCEHCGNNIQEGHKFCMKCGKLILNHSVAQASNLDQNWWLRVAKVIYIFLHLPLPLVLWGVWYANSTSYNYYKKVYSDTTGKAFWYSILTLIIYLVILRLIKITFLYIAFAEKANWQKEFKKFY